ncbi:hypothetical protein [Aegicerativicinus sediminis]
MKKLSLLVFTSLLILSCSSDSEDDVTDPGGNGNDPGSTTITYNTHIAPIMSSNCVSCHGSTPSNGASVSLTTYSQVKSAVENNQLIQRINSTQAGYAMPFNGAQLPQTSRDRIEAWRDGGFIE